MEQIYKQNNKNKIFLSGFDYLPCFLGKNPIVAD